MRRQPQVDPNQIAVLGGSRGSEAAQLLGVHYPKLVHAVIATVPSDVAICSYAGCAGPAWTLDGHAIPYTSQFDQPHPSGQADAVIPDQRIHGPVLLVCGGQDKVWRSCAYSAAIQQRLNAAHFRPAHLLYRYPNAGHALAELQPLRTDGRGRVRPARWYTPSQPTGRRTELATTSGVPENIQPPVVGSGSHSGSNATGLRRDIPA